jgi:hypothetical protein
MDEYNKWLKDQADDEYGRALDVSYMAVQAVPHLLAALYYQNKVIINLLQHPVEDTEPRESSVGELRLFPVEGTGSEHD